MISIAQPQTHLEAIDQFLLSVEDAMEHPKANDLDRQLGEVVIASMEAQKPYVEEGLLTVIDLGRVA